MAIARTSLGLTKKTIPTLNPSRLFEPFVSVHTQANDVVFSKKQRVKHLDLSASNKDAHVYDYLRDHVAKDICDRVEDLKYDGKRTILNIGSCSGLISKNINPKRVETFIQADISHKGLLRTRRLDSVLKPKFFIDYVHCDEEFLPFKNGSADLVVSCLDLHWVNDLKVCFRQVNNVLRDNSPFIGVMFGGDTLYELRSALQLAELERLSAFSSHVAPKTTGQDIASLLQLNGFKLITVDIADITINYPSMFELMFDLQGMGESNKSIIPSEHIHRDVLQAAAAIYHSLYGRDEIGKGVPATFQLVHFIGWRNPIRAKTEQP